MQAAICEPQTATSRFNEMIDSQRFVYIPRPARIAALVALTACFVVALVTVAAFVAMEDPSAPRFSDWILVGMTLIQLSLSGLAIALVLFYSEREEDATALEAKSRHVLREQMTRMLRKVTPAYELRNTPSKVQVLGASDIFGCGYRVSSGAREMQVWIGLNVSRVFVIFWLLPPQQAAGAAAARAVEKVFQYTFGGASDVGYKTRFEAVEVNGETVVSIWSTVDTGSNLLTEPGKRLFWLQDVAMMIESFWRTAIRNQLAFAGQEPGPL